MFPGDGGGATMAVSRIPMTNPNTMIEANGEQVTLERVTNAVFDTYDEFDESASTIEQVTLDAVLSEPSERDVVRAEGRGEVASLKASVDSSIDIDEARDGRADRIKARGKWYKVGEVKHDTHPMMDIEKKTVILQPLPGR